MSDDEKALLIGKVIMEHQAALRRIIELRANAEQLARFIDGVSTALKPGNRAIVTSQTGNRLSLVAAVGGKESIGDWPSAEGIVALLRAIETAEGDASELERRRHELGI